MLYPLRLLFVGITNERKGIQSPNSQFWQSFGKQKDRSLAIRG